MAPFVETFCRPELDQQAHPYICGLLSDVARKNIASIAYRFGQDRLPLQRFLGWAPWEDEPLRQELTRQVAEHLGRADGVLVFDPSGFPKSGPESVGVARQWRGRRPAGGAVPRRRLGNASRRGVPRLTRTPGSGSTCATAPQGRWWLPGSHDVWWRGRRGGNKAMRSCESCDATATATTSRWCRSMLLWPTPRLRHRWGSWPVWPKPNIASKHAASAARVKPD